jgi:hypothetical protein
MPLWGTPAAAGYDDLPTNSRDKDMNARKWPKGTGQSAVAERAQAIAARRLRRLAALLVETILVELAEIRYIASPRQDLQ